MTATLKAKARAMMRNGSYSLRQMPWLVQPLPLAPLTAEMWDFLRKNPHLAPEPHALVVHTGSAAPRPPK